MPVVLDEAKLDVIDREAVVKSHADIAAYLQETLGQKMTAYLGGLVDVKEVGQWAKGNVRPRQMADMRIRCAYRVVRMIVESYGADTAKAWLFGTNTRLRDEAPAYLLRHSKSVEDIKDIVPVARAFAGSVE